MVFRLPLLVSGVYGSLEPVNLLQSSVEIDSDGETLQVTDAAGMLQGDDTTYIRASDQGTAIHAYGGTRSGNKLTMYSCPESANYPNCQWVLEPSPTRRGMYYIRASDQGTYLHAFGGTQEGHHLTMYSCPKRNDHPNCQWALEPSPTRRGMYYIKASDRSEYIHAHGGTNGGNQLTMYSCPKSRDYPNCQWRLELPNDELANELTAELEDLTADYNTLKAECNAIAARANRISDGYHDLRTRYEELKADYNAKFGLLQADGKVFQSNDDKVNELKERLADTKAEYSMLKAECNENTAATEDMTVEYKDLDHRYKALQAEYEAKSR